MGLELQFPHWGILRVPGYWCLESLETVAVPQPSAQPLSSLLPCSHALACCAATAVKDWPKSCRLRSRGSRYPFTVTRFRSKACLREPDLEMLTAPAASICERRVCASRRAGGGFDLRGGPSAASPADCWGPQGEPMCPRWVKPFQALELGP